MLRRVKCKAGHTIFLPSQRYRRKPSGLCKIKKRTGYEMTSLETTLKTEACNPEAPSLIGRKSLKSWISDRGDPFESGDSGENSTRCSETSRFSHLITSRPQIRLIIDKARIVSSSEIAEPRKLHLDTTLTGSSSISCDALGTRGVHAAR